MTAEVATNEFHDQVYSVCEQQQMMVRRPILFTLDSLRVSIFKKITPATAGSALNTADVLSLLWL